MPLDDFFKGAARRFATPPPHDVTGGYQAPARGLDDASRRLLEEELPRGIPFGRVGQNRSEKAQWASPAQIGDLAYRDGDIILGKFGGRMLGYRDDKPMITIASARSGKSSTVLIPNLLTYRGAMLVLDPKGELAQATAAHRRQVLGAKVHILDPFGCARGAGETGHFNALAELDPASPMIVDDVDKITQALIVHEGNGDPHWTDSARLLLRGLILQVLTMAEKDRSLVTVRQFLTLTYEPLLLAAKDRLRRTPESGTNVRELAERMLFERMADAGNAFGGALAIAGMSLLRKSERERAAIISTAETQTGFLDSIPLRGISQKSDFKLVDLAEGNTTIYLCLSVSELAKHFRWLRVVVQLALLALERRGAWPRDKLPIIFLLEEMALLQHLQILESAVAYMPGFGVKLWGVLQDLVQLQRHYPDSWQTFIGNAGVVQFFGSNDTTTLDYLSARLGMISFMLKAEENEDLGSEAAHKEKLLYGHEIARVFARGTGAQGLLIDGRAPLAVLRLEHGDVDALRRMNRMIPDGT